MICGNEDWGEFARQNAQITSTVALLEGLDYSQMERSTDGANKWVSAFPSICVKLRFVSRTA